MNKETLISQFIADTEKMYDEEFSILTESVIYIHQLIDKDDGSFEGIRFPINNPSEHWYPERFAIIDEVLDYYESLSDENLISGSADTKIKIWNLEGTCLSTFDVHLASITSIIQINKNTIISSDDSGSIIIWSLNDKLIKYIFLRYLYFKVYSFEPISDAIRDNLIN